MEFKSSALYIVTRLPWDWPVPCYQVPSPFPQSWFFFFYCLFIYTLELWCHLQIDLLTCTHLLSIDLLKCKHPREEKHTLWYELPLPCFAQLLAKHRGLEIKGGLYMWREVKRQCLILSTRGVELVAPLCGAWGSADSRGDGHWKRGGDVRFHQDKLSRFHFYLSSLSRKDKNTWEGPDLDLIP